MLVLSIVLFFIRSPRTIGDINKITNKKIKI